MVSRMHLVGCPVLCFTAFCYSTATRILAPHSPLRHEGGRWRTSLPSRRQSAVQAGQYSRSAGERDAGQQRGEGGAEF